MHEAHQPVGIVTKNALVLRDLDLLSPMAADRLVHVNISVTTLDAELARTMEPRTSTPEARLRTISELAAAGIPVRVLVAPVIPGLNDHQIAEILQAVSRAGARAAGYVLLRLPYSVKPVFREWLLRHWPDKQARVGALVRQTRGGRLNDPSFETRMRGTGQYAEQIENSFAIFAKRFGLDGPLTPLDSTRFRAPRAAGDQLWLF
jgi:DNA repair photolyase